MIQRTFLSRFFFGGSKYLSPIVGTPKTMPTNEASLSLLNHVTSTNNKYLSFQCSSTEFIRAVTGGSAVSNADQLLDLREESCDGKKT